MHTRLKISWKYKLGLLLALVSCSPDPVVDYGMGEYYVEISTALDDHAFLLDNGQTVYDSNGTANRTFDSGDRVYLSFSYGETLSDPITVHGAIKIFSDTLKLTQEDKLLQQKNDPVRFESAWTGSHYLNLKFYMEFYSETHKIALLIDEDHVKDSEVHLYFTHDKNNDAAGYWVSLYASYDLSQVLGEPDGDRMLFVHCNTTGSGNTIYTVKY
ncbi:MAG: hypothetical protein LBS46_05915 [Dysgonamonadaceae bacterium]|jgi:hypothetical protein|nr:hypothetical protein [Dysgonamonadaceae bacterium]